MILDKFFKKKPSISISPRTTKLIEDLRAVEWFANSGRQAPDNGRVVFVKDWDEAIAAFQTEMFDDATREAKNLMLRLYHQNHASNWNDLMDVLKPIVMPMAKEKIGSAKEKSLCPSKLPDSIHLDLLLVAFYIQCRDSLPEIEYYEEILHWYLAGYFPCGWVGEVSEDFEHSFQLGKLIVF